MPLKTRHNEELTLNLTPMIDVVFLLIIFFMVATNFSDMKRNVDLELPQVAGAGNTPAPQKPRVVTVFADGSVELDDVRVTRDELISLLAEARRTHGDVEVVLEGDGNCPFQYVADTLAACQQADITQIGLTVELARAMSSPPVR